MRLSFDKARKIARAGKTLYRVWMSSPTTAYVDVQVLRGKYPCGLNGTLGAYFTKRKQAERFADEINQGMHPSLAQQWGKYIDRLNDMCHIFNLSVVHNLDCQSIPKKKDSMFSAPSQLVMSDVSL